MTRLLAAMTACSALVLTTAMPAAAAPRGRADEWWFSAWAIEKKVWPISKGAGVTVAVIDNGVNGRIPDLQGALVRGADVSSGGSVEPSGGGDGQIGPTSDVDDSHGTAMAGLIASQGTGTGYVGVAPEAKIMSVKSHFYVWDKAIRFAADHGAKVISISQASAATAGCRPNIQEAVAYAVQRDAVVVVGAGNEGDGLNRPMEPANCAGALVIGAIDNQMQPWSGSERQSYVAAAAPGEKVNAIQADGRVQADLSGTSQATALTSAVAALIRSKYPQMSAREVVQRIINTTADVGPRGKDDSTGYGVVIPHAALTAKVPKSAPNPVYAVYDQWMKAHAPQQSATPPAKKSASEEKAERNTRFLIIGAAAVIVLAVLMIVFFLVRGRRRPRIVRAGVGPVSAPQQYGPLPGPGTGPPPGWGGPAGPPPPPPGHQDGRPPYVPPNSPGGSRPPN